MSDATCTCAHPESSHHPTSGCMVEERRGRCPCLKHGPVVGRSSEQALALYDAALTELASLRTRLSAAEGERDNEREVTHEITLRCEALAREANADRDRADAAEAGWANERAIWLRVNAAQARSLEEARAALRKLHDVAEGECKAGLGFTEAMASALVDARRALATPSPEGKPSCG